jgi:hypothetical protein
VTNDEIEKLALEAGFSLKEQYDGSMGLNPYVFKFAQLLLEVKKMEIESLRHESSTCRALYCAAVGQRNDARRHAFILMDSKRELLGAAEKACQYLEKVKDALQELGAQVDESTVCNITTDLRAALDRWARLH